jgi:hypothetical protein
MMKAVDENGLEFDVFQCGVNCVRDIYWNVYILKEQEGEEETYSAAPDRLAGSPEIITVERCICEGENDPAPGAAWFNGDHIERCDDCKRFADDTDAASAYAAGLNRAVGHAHFVQCLNEDGRECIALARKPKEALDEESIDVELKKLKVTIMSAPYLRKNEES